MPTNTTTPPGGGFEAEPQDMPNNATTLNPSLGETATVINETSLTATGSQPSMLSNQAYSNTVQTSNLSSQNAISNQQTMSRLRIVNVGKAVNNVSNLNPLEARSSVDVLTNNELAQTIMDLKASVDAFSGGGSGPYPITPTGLLKLLQEFLKLLVEIENDNAEITGDGSYENPYSSSGTIYFNAPIILGFKGLTPNQVKLIADQQAFSVSG